jgi:trehalose 6-phosphate synthase
MAGGSGPFPAHCCCAAVFSGHFAGGRLRTVEGFFAALATSKETPAVKLVVRFFLPLFGALAVMALVLTPLADRMLAQWFRSDVEIRSRLVWNSVARPLSGLLAADNGGAITDLFNAVARDERVLAMGRCSAEGRLLEHSASWPPALACAPSLPPAQGAFVEDTVGGGPILSASFPLVDSAGRASRIIIVHDLSFVARRTAEAWAYMIAAIAALGAVSALVTIAMARLTLAGWLSSMRDSLARGADAPSDVRADPALAPVVDEIQQLLRDLDISRATSAGIRPDWNAASLRDAVRTELPNADLIVVSNREPYIHNTKADGRIEVQRPASGLVTALEPIIQACGGTWIAHGSGSADRAVVDQHDRVAVPPHEESYTLKRIWLSEAEERGYYYGFANEGLWPLCHISYVRPVFRQEDWEEYLAVNRRFAEAVVAEAKSDRPLVLVQDYHLALVPRFIREKLPHATIVTFWHIPWPNAEVFGICPWRQRILDGLLGSTVVGFHTQLHCNNFIESADRFLECHIDREESTVAVHGEAAAVRPYPISIAWPPAELAGQPPVPACREKIFAAYNLPDATRLAVGVERLDFTKGIPDRFRAVGFLLERVPEWRGRFVLLQIAAPSRSDLPAYRALREEAEAAAAEVNAKFGTADYQPIRLIVEHTEPADVFTLFRAADLCIVSSLHDGMNLVAKEFVAARDDDRGVLVLSTFAGASRELMEALIVNPFDARATAEAIDRALRMPDSEQRDRMQLMRATVSENNVYYWAGRMLLDAARLRKRARILETISRAKRRG